MPGRIHIINTKAIHSRPKLKASYATTGSEDASLPGHPISTVFIQLHCSSDSLVNKTSRVNTSWSTVFISTDCSQLHTPRVLHFPGRWQAVNSGSHDLQHRTTSRLHWTASAWYLTDSWSELTRDGPETETSPSNLGYQSKCLSLDRLMTRSWEFTSRTHPWN